MSSLQSTLNPGVPAKVRKFWFEHLDKDEQLIVPAMDANKKWFTKDEQFDKACVAKFGSYLEAIRSSNATADDILDAVKPASSLDWLGTILLLDQLPRNSFRGEEAQVVFQVFDPLAQEMTKRAIAAGVLQDPKVRYRLTYQTWFHLPLMHSEDLELHRLCARLMEEALSDVHALVAADESSADAGVRECREVLSKNLEGVEKYMTNAMGFEKKHQVIIERFGRYPHRNKAMRRQPTPEEEAYLRDGGETFAG